MMTLNAPFMSIDWKNLKSVSAEANSMKSVKSSGVRKCFKKETFAAQNKSIHLCTDRQGQCLYLFWGDILAVLLMKTPPEEKTGERTERERDQWMAAE